MTFLISTIGLIFHYLHPHDCYRLTSEKFWTRPVFFFVASWQYIPVAVSLGGRSRTALSKQDCFFVQEAEGSDFTYICKISLWAFFAPSLASSCFICTAASNFWINLAECELLYSALGDRLLLLQVTCAWALLRRGLDIEKDRTACL